MEPELSPPELDDADVMVGSLGPQSFMRGALPGGFSGAGLQLIFAWLGFQVLSSTLWALHLKRLVGWSSLPSYWGEQLTARDVWEIAVNGNLAEHPFGFWTSLVALGFLSWAMWAGWKIQAGAAQQKPGFAPWILGLLDACVVGILPILLVESSLIWILQKLASSGIQGLGWLNLVGGALVRLTAVSAFLLQWWLCRINRAAAPGWNLGSWGALGRHLGRSFLRLWAHPVEWGLLLLGGVIVRFGLHVMVLALAWRWGGGSPARVWAFLILEALVTIIAAWLMGWMLRVVAGFWAHDARLRNEIRNLQRRAVGAPVQAHVEAPVEG